MAQLDQHRYPPIDAMLVVADAIKVMLETDPHASVREALGDLDELREAVDCLEAYHRFEPDHVSRRRINAELRAHAWSRGEE